MKRIISILIALILSVSEARAQAVTGTGIANSCGLAQSCGALIAGIQTSSGSLIPAADNTYDVGSSSVGFRTGYFDTSVITPKVSHATSLGLAIAGTNNLTLASGTLLASVDGFVFGSDTADAADNKEIDYTASGSGSINRGGKLATYGNEVASIGGRAALIGGAVSTGSILVQTNHASANIIFQPNAATMWTMAASGTLIGAGTSDIGWSVVAGANTACNTTCVTPCVFGQETTSKAILACTDATADVCLCAGAS